MVQLWDELCHFTERQYLYLMSRCRTSDPTIRCYIRAGTNPGGIGHTWIKMRFIDNCPPYQTYTDPITGLTRCFIPAKVTDNPTLMQNDPLYVRRLEALPEAEREALLHGNWDIFSGQVFREFSRAEHVVEPFSIPEHWPRYISVDWGYSKPFAIYWYACDHDGKLWVYREYYGCPEGRANVGLELDPYEVGRQMAMLERDEISKGIETVGFADPACWNTQGGPSVIEELSRGYTSVAGREIAFIKGNNDRLNGKHQLHVRLKRKLIAWFSPCVHAIRTIPALPYSITRVEDVDTNAEDHAYDSCKYLLLSRPVDATITVEQKWPTHEDRVWQQLNRLDRSTQPRDPYLGDDW